MNIYTLPEWAVVVVSLVVGFIFCELRHLIFDKGDNFYMNRCDSLEKIIEQQEKETNELKKAKEQEAEANIVLTERVVKQKELIKQYITERKNEVSR